MSSSEKLADALQAAGASPRLIEAARRGTYDDFKSHLGVPKMALVEAIRGNHRMSIGERDRLVERVKDGEFDSTPEEAQDYMRSERGQEDIAALLRGEAP